MFPLSACLHLSRDSIWTWPLPSLSLHTGGSMSVGTEHQIHSPAGLTKWPDFYWAYSVCSCPMLLNCSTDSVFTAQLVTFALTNEYVCWLKILNAYIFLKRT